MKTHTFVRQKIERESIRSITDRDIENIPAYKKVLDVPVDSKKHTTREVLAIARHSLGDEMLQRLLPMGSDDVVHTASEVIEDHLYSPDVMHTKDLQVNLVANIVKEISTENNIPRAKRCAFADELMDKLQLDQSFRREVSKSLYDGGAIYRPWLTIARYQE